MLLSGTVFFFDPGCCVFPLFSSLISPPRENRSLTPFRLRFRFPPLSLSLLDFEFFTCFFPETPSVAFFFPSVKKLWIIESDPSPPPILPRLTREGHKQRRTLHLSSSSFPPTYFAEKDFAGNQTSDGSSRQEFSFRDQVFLSRSCRFPVPQIYQGARFPIPSTNSNIVPLEVALLAAPSRLYLPLRILSPDPPIHQVIERQPFRHIFFPYSFFNDQKQT